MLLWRPRRGGREAECAGLENRSGCKPTVGSNPTPSATLTDDVPAVVAAYRWHVALPFPRRSRGLRRRDRRAAGDGRHRRTGVRASARQLHGQSRHSRRDWSGRDDHGGPRPGRDPGVRGHPRHRRRWRRAPEPDRRRPVRRDDVCDLGLRPGRLDRRLRVRAGAAHRTRPRPPVWRRRTTDAPARLPLRGRCGRSGRGRNPRAVGDGSDGRRPNWLARGLGRGRRRSHDRRERRPRDEPERPPHRRTRSRR